jgi:V/A-type H+-transporting ATPase subunit E
MTDQNTQVKALQDAIIKRAHELAEEHVSKGRLTSQRIMQDARDKLKLMEKKELLLAKENAEREYHRLVQASELRLQSELDRNRWGLVQAVMQQVNERIGVFAEDADAYADTLKALIRHAASELGGGALVAELNHRDQRRFGRDWKGFTSGIDATIELSSNDCPCSGGVRLKTADNDMMVDNTFEGIISRRNDELMRVIFERLFSQVQSIGGVQHG